MQDPKIYVFLSASNEVKSAITCKACNANVIVNPLDMPTTVHLIRDTTDTGAIEKLKLLVPNGVAKGIGGWQLNDLLKLWEVNTEVSAKVVAPVADVSKSKSKREYYKDFKEDIAKAGEYMLSSEEKVVLNKVLDLVKL